MKKGRENNQFLPRKFVLSEVENTIKYYVKDKKEPKARKTNGLSLGSFIFVFYFRQSLRSQI